MSSLDTANEGAYIEHDFPVLIPWGNLQTGHKYGHHDMCYIEYMTAAIKLLVVIGGVQNYLNNGTFVKDKHAKKVMAIMDRKLPGYEAPIPRPTWSHMFDFNLTFAGACLIDGECKGSAAEHEKAVLILHSLELLALKETALAMLTTNNSFIFYRSKLVSGPESVQTKYDESNKYDLGPVSDIKKYPGANLDEYKTPPTFDASSDVLCRVVIKENDKVLECWKRNEVWKEEIHCYCIVCHWCFESRDNRNVCRRCSSETRDVQLMKEVGENLVSLQQWMQI